jgi:hypothetical protein
MKINSLSVAAGA